MEIRAEAIEIKDYHDDGKLEMRVVKLRLPHESNFIYKAGQYAMLSMDGFTLRANPHALKWTSYSISSAPHHEGTIEFCFKIKETNGFTQYVKDHMQLGTKVGVKGPFGNFTNEHPQKKILMVATGSGIAPIMGMIRHLVHANSDVEIMLVYGMRNTNYFVFREELEKYARSHPKFILMPTLSRPDHKWDGRKGYVQGVLKDMKIDDISSTQAFICGNPQMVAEVKTLLLEKGFDKAKVHVEQWEGA
ncbi:hypothetical protein HY989_05015 [Candidatus Micrarchaeota archaeon]|nr:hypothetical protein [Candidatus Micrarchaeota archaeon]